MGTEASAYWGVRARNDTGPRRGLRAGGAGVWTERRTAARAALRPGEGLPVGRQQWPAIMPISEPDAANGSLERSWRMIARISARRGRTPPNHVVEYGL